MHIVIDDIEIDIGININYPETNPTTGAPSDKVKYHLTQQNNKILAALVSLADLLERVKEDVDMTRIEYIWAADDDTIMAADDDTILMFRSDMQDFIITVQERIDTIEEDVEQLADQPVITYADPTN